jgi:hypothetical protein
MNLAHHLSLKREAIFSKWRELLFASYAPETVGFFKKERDRFNNPVAFRLSEGLKGLWAALLEGADPDEVAAHLDEIIRIRAVQDFSPAQSLAFIFLLKNVIREELIKEIKGDAGVVAEVLELESRIDGLALMAFDVFMKRREKLYEVKVDEVKSRVSGLLRKAGYDLGAV